MRKNERKGTVYVRGNKLWVAFYDANGERKYLSTGLDVGQERKARSVLDKINERVAAGAALGERELGPTTVRRYAEKWLEKRRAKGLSSAGANAFQLEHALKHIGDMALVDVKPKHIREMVEELKTNGQCHRVKGKLANRTILHSYRILKTMMRQAEVEGLIEKNPCNLQREELPKLKHKDPLWRRTALFTRKEIEIIISDERIPMFRRVWYALEGLAGLRFGEAAALRWRAWDEMAEPLTRLEIVAAYDSTNEREKTTKTDNPRAVPVHPKLQSMLRVWRDEWQTKHGRAPRPDDLIVPAEGLTFRHKNDGWTEQNEDLQTLGLRHRRQHDFRRTFISLARDGGARGDMLKWITHGPQRNDILDEYTTPVWKTLCDQVLCVKLDDEPTTDEKRSDLVLLEQKTTDQPDPQLLQQLLQSIAFLSDFKQLNGWGTRIRT